MADILPTVDHIIPRGEVLYVANLFSGVGNSTQEKIDLSLVSRHLIQIHGMSVGVDAICIEASVNGTTFDVLPLSQAGICVYSGSLVGTNIKGDGFLSTTMLLKYLRLKHTGITASAISVDYFGRS